ncbi:MAG: SUMF1/EgtB/PvdO family nonheme iron enzyme [bacterium]|nr:SUMF1/EgtB/PvdO family nonheme iron enzyme [bacterium]
MDAELLCMGCMTERENAGLCSRCGYEEVEPGSPIILSPRTGLMNGHYLVGRMLGKLGGFGITYLGWDTKLETKVAIKEFLPRDLAGRDTGRSTVVPHHDDDKELFAYGLDRFVQEARTLAQFDHPNVVRVRTFFEENGTAYLVMNYYDGIPLNQYLEDKGGRLDEKLAIDIMMPIMDGIRAVHEKGFLHRDIKPQNIYLTEGGLPILLDFGAARFAIGQRNKSLSVVITPGYAPFEQYQKKGKHGPWTDVYSTAATLYNMVTGVMPLEAPDRVIEDELEPVEKLVPGSSSQLSEALILALSVKPGKRPQSIREFQDLFIDEDEPEVIPPDKTVEIEDAVFHFAKKIGSKDSLELFLSQYPYSDHTGEVKDLLTNIAAPTVEGPLTFEYREERRGGILLEGAFGKQGKENVLVWEHDNEIKDRFPDAYRNKKGFWEFKVSGDQFDDLVMVYIPAGEFIMGSNDIQAANNEKPLHKVFLDGYWIGKYEVTFGQFDIFCEQTGLYSKGIIHQRNTPYDEGWGRGKNPVIHVSWQDTREYCEWLMEKTERVFKLPSEAQWEKAAKGTDNRKYCWGNKPPDGKLANLGESGNWKTTPVTQYPKGASPYGVMDMNGNVLEWCSDFYEEHYYETSPAKNPVGPSSGNKYVKRGGAFSYEAKAIRNACRSGSSSSYHSTNLGFRLVMVNK